MVDWGGNVILVKPVASSFTFIISGITLSKCEIYFCHLDGVTVDQKRNQLLFRLGLGNPLNVFLLCEVYNH